MCLTVYLRNAKLSWNNHILFHHLNLDLPAKKWVCLLGKSGVGKTSLLRLLAGLIHSTQATGDVQCSDQKPLAGRLNYLSQQDSLLPWLNLTQNVLVGFTLRSQKPSPEQVQLAEHCLSQVGLKENIQDYPAKLSGGMRQRVMLARTLMEKKPLVLMDEPFSALDAITRVELQELAFETLKDCTVLMITHDPLEALRLSHIMYWMHGKPAHLTPVELPKTLPLRTLSDHEVLKAHGKWLIDLQK